MQPYNPTKVPVTVYRSTDAGAPELKAEAGSLKTLLKTCLVSGYGGKQGLGWQMHNESGNRAVFHFGAGFGLDVDSGNNDYSLCTFRGGATFAADLGYPNPNTNTFTYKAGYQGNVAEWMLVGHAQAFALVLAQNYNRKIDRSQILLFGRFAGPYADSGNVCYLNTSYREKQSEIDNGTIGDDGKPPLVAVSQYIDGNTNPHRSVEGAVRMQFTDVAAPFPDALYQGYVASQIGVSDAQSVRCFLPLYCSYHDLSSLPELTDLQDGCVKLNLHDGADPKYCFALNTREWEV